MEKPILFSAPMVRAILDGHKTMTRRVVKPAWIPIIEESARVNGHPALECLAGDIVQSYGSIGDRLWVRETWSANLPEINYRAGGARMIHEGEPHYIDLMKSYDTQVGKWRPSIFMPRWASRITLEVVGVRVERLHDISDADAKAEGIQETDNLFVYAPGKCVDKREGATAKDAFRHLWDSINGEKYPWASNLWVWVIEFKKVSELYAKK